MDVKKEEKEVQKVEEEKVSRKTTAPESIAAGSSAYIPSQDGKGNAFPHNTKRFLTGVLVMISLL